MPVTDQDWKLLATHVGAGDQAAFRQLYALLAPATLAAVLLDVPERGHAVSVVRATFCEVWWMCAFDRRRSPRHRNVPQWIAGIAERRGGERRQALDLMEGDRPATGHTASWPGLLADQDQLTDRELVTMLDGQDAILPRTTWRT
jgi:hypothetical protein